MKVLLQSIGWKTAYQKAIRNDEKNKTTLGNDDFRTNAKDVKNYKPVAETSFLITQTAANLQAILKAFCTSCFS